LSDRGFAPLWQQIAELGLVAAIHPSVGITNPDATSEGTFIERVSSQMDIGHSVAETVAYMQDNALFLISSCYEGLMEDYPSLKLALVHGYASMTPLVLEKAETYLWVGSNYRRGVAMPEPVSLAPEDVFYQHPSVVQFDSWETAVAELPQVFGTKAGWGSRYPHHDASSPAEAVQMLEAHGVDETVIARLMGGNAVELFGLSVASPVT
jgi:hypothetical protein